MLALSVLMVDPSHHEDLFGDSVSQKDLMVRLLQGIPNKTVIVLDYKDDFKYWQKVKLDDFGDVISIDWSNSLLKGRIDLRALPPTLQTLRLNNNFLRGPLDLTSLPDTLETLCLQSNGFSGDVDFSRLPASLKYLDVSKTGLQGEVVHFDGELKVENSKVKDKRVE
mmetsp:Transcript_23589/g.36792  ORF Transcript_23589/g.36792 Transcript_23589/m.36792 type:complete len:167 (-) Transcript_23589:65-565(-)|eukprot:CAMPEP_0201521432 /NCGR_PEP_ID=MMETSP0161_2-20130828/14418_1 /ASSEMBLY_ACC=CAM_ASM_000251 /TAXON_ID=180227 /ORGANISM="Neoparamoeba aestuarina, Strain SoJaBio B1-5/56/2" /LENGTH=166 /DNA_ID=CAMNT_0047920069 /DNA_START=31 /DNA_END=531 /DNA_ORIENTATION=-